MNTHPAISPAPPQPADAARPRDATRDVLVCPLCDYDLRGLTEPRCPECGYRFAWEDLTDPSRRLHRYLFEHHPKRNAWSFFRTLVAGFASARFWTSIHPAQRSRPARLVAYWLAALLPLVVILAAYYGLWFTQAAAASQARRAIMLQSLSTAQKQAVARQFGSLQQYLDQFEPAPPNRRFYRQAWQEEGWWTIHLAAFWAAWPLLMFLTLLVFRVSMRRARIRPAHVLRCVLYSYDVAFWLAWPVAAAVVVRALSWYGLVPSRLFVPPAPLPQDHIFQYRPEMTTDTLFWGALFLVLIGGYRLTAAFRHYLRFDHAAATVACAHMIAALLVLLIVVQKWAG